MLRFALEYLKTWKSKPNRKPLVIRGARQVGKTYLVRLFAKEYFDQLAEINFERDPEIASLFTSNDPRKIVQLLELQYNIPIRAGSALLFLALIVPIEVKAGKSGTLKSLHLFLREKHRSLGVRFNTDIPSVLETQTALSDGLNIPYRLLSLPLYMVGQARRLIRQSTRGGN